MRSIIVPILGVFVSGTAFANAADSNSLGYCYIDGKTIAIKTDAVLKKSLYVFGQADLRSDLSVEMGASYAYSAIHYTLFIMAGEKEIGSVAAYLPDPYWVLSDADYKNFSEEPAQLSWYGEYNGSYIKCDYFLANAEKFLDYPRHW